MSSPRLVINETFFQQLWPLILEENICDTHSQHTSPFFVPKKQFDSLWAHGFLASKGYGEYEPPICFYVPPSTLSDDDSIESISKRVPIQLEEEEEEICESKERNRILTLNEQFDELRRQEEQRHKLVNDFKNRSVPWYVGSCSLDKEFLNDLEKVFVKPFERNLLHAIHAFECKFMIINVNANYSLSHIENWLKFCKYVKIVLVVRKEEIAKKLAPLNPALYPLLIEDICENSWQVELTRALNAGVCHAEEANIMTNCAMAFAYVFSSRSDLDCFNRYKIIRKK